MVIVLVPVMTPLAPPREMLFAAAIVSKVKLLLSATGPVKKRFPVPFCMVRVPVPPTMDKAFGAVPVATTNTTFSEPPTLPKVIVPFPTLVAVPAYKVPALTLMPPEKVFVPVVRDKVPVPSFVREPVPEIVPLRVWFAELA